MKKLLIRGALLGIVYLGIALFGAIRLQERLNEESSRGRHVSYDVLDTYWTFAFPLSLTVESFFGRINSNHVGVYAYLILWSICLGIGVSYLWHYLGRFPSRRRLLSIACSLLVLAGSICLYHHRDHVRLNLRMRGAAQVRRDCDALMAGKVVAAPDKSIRRLKPYEIPPSLARLRPQLVEVRQDCVLICTYYAGSLTDGMWGYMYHPQPLNSVGEWPDLVEPLWYRDFYEFRVRGE